MTDLIALPSRLDLPAGEALLQNLENHEGAFRFDASEVTQIGALCMQILVAASRHARAQDLDFELNGLTDAVAGQLALMGCPADRLAKGDI